MKRIPTTLPAQEGCRAAATSDPISLLFCAVGHTKTSFLLLQPDGVKLYVRTASCLGKANKLLTWFTDNIESDLDRGYLTSRSPRPTDNESYPHKRPSMGENKYFLMRKKQG